MTANEQPSSDAQPAVPPERYRWLPTFELQPGMVLARPVWGQRGDHAVMSLAVGSQISAATIAQMVVNGVPCAAVWDSTLPPVEAAETAQFLRRLDEIFGPEPSAECQELYALLRSEGVAP